MRYEIPIQIIELEPENYHPLIECRFDHENSGYWVIDTGASRSVFDSGLEQWYSLNEDSSNMLQSAGINGDPFNSHVAVLKSLSFGDFDLSGESIALISLEQINELYSRFTDVKIAGLVGSDWLCRFNAIIDFERKVLVLNR
ncbi:MAG: hypothetical protein Q8862_07930 [Bacteroidota bacterium]|nr:hypothetical protein [Bacteroidota bacterium]